MKGVTIFYTPGTGLPDFEMRIALGLCGAALNSVKPEKIRLIEEFDRYLIKIDEESNIANSLMTKALGWLCQNRLSDQSLLLRIPGFRRRHIDNQSSKLADFGKKLLSTGGDLNNVFVENVRGRKGSHATACGHKYPKAKKITDAILPLSPQLGKPPKRNSSILNPPGIPLCPYCVATSIAGTVYFQMNVNINNPDRSKKERFFFLPHFRGESTGEQLAIYLAVAKHLSGNLENIPASTALIVLLSLYPHLIDSFHDSVSSFFVGRAESSGNVTRYGYQAEQSASIEFPFLKDVYNRALVQDCYRSNERSRLLSLFTDSLHNLEEKSALDFARTYVGVKEGKMMLPWATTEFFIKEAFNMDKSLLEGDKFDVIKKVSDMLQYFVRERNFGYVDNLRKARDADEFAKLLLDAQREAQSGMLDPKKQAKPYLPGQSTIQNMLLLVNDNEKQFHSVQTLVALLAFTYYKKEA
ncbi:MAG: hypothetical protein JRJ77_11815 [Deltaproteobacteria bacterium]|nr:hypothetical protein [Deltaproteobacteria bacterium]